jgi:ribosomal protein L7/L12
MDIKARERMNTLAMKVQTLEAQLAHVYRHLGLTAPAPEPLDEVGALLAQGNKLAAIARYRELTGKGLGDAKQAVDDLAARLGFE